MTARVVAAPERPIVSHGSPDDQMWTSKLRHRMFDNLPPERLLPDEQPAYVSSWIYVFGVLTLAALAVIIASGMVLAFAGPTWYHTSGVGHFVNSLHFWSVQIFFFVMVVHLWGKFWMAAWRGRRVLTWVSGAIAFLASIGAAFTGYLVQTNFASQWISAEAKDGLNSVGIGAWFNVMDVGQALLVHVALVPTVLALIVVWHVLLVRRRGVVPPIDGPDGAAGRGTRDVAAEPWRGLNRRYDIVKEFAVALTVVSLLTVALSALWSSPDEKAITLQRWATAAPADFVATASAELDGSSGTASYGAPYVDLKGAGQSIGPINLQKWAGVRIPVDPARQFVVVPLRTSLDPSVSGALAQWDGASGTQQVAWAAAFNAALGKAPDGDPAKVATGDYGPVPQMTAALLRQAQSGALDGPLALGGRFFQTDYTTSTLFLADGTYLEDQAVKEHLAGDQSGMMNETGAYPGQEWLWLYTFWYQIKPFSSEANSWGANADAIIWALMAVLSLGFILLPYIPGLRSLPRWVPVHRLIWREWYRSRSTG
ncbi:MAG: hypothetical protein QOJ90_1789 [Actinomycetota bacterium]|nr:hypothetical protein [Actinomycetota bacterium]